jgi:hypothetical protein
MVDVGCGIGGSSRHIARKYGCSARGITLSPVQAARANAISGKEGLGDRVSFQVRVCSSSLLHLPRVVVVCQSPSDPRPPPPPPQRPTRHP